MINDLYDNIDEGSKLILFLKKKNVLPDPLGKEEKTIIKSVEKFAAQMKERKKQLENWDVNEQIAKQKDQRRNEKLELESKENKTEEDLQRLQYLTYIEQLPEENLNGMLADTIEASKEDLKYNGINTLLA
ncbi:MAG: hypothetical protein K6E76_04390 [Patescibacteria group bacterium]|nr:hypothetical protein [Patescibacteria group bacterium]